MPKLRWGNKEREWQILRCPGRGLDSLLNFTLSLYVMGLSLRDLQEALYPILGSVLSVNAINRSTLEAQTHMDEHRQSPINQTKGDLNRGWSLGGYSVRPRRIQDRPCRT